MPEIKDTTNKPKQEVQFVLPDRRRFNAWRIVVPFLLIAALGGGWFARAFVNQVSAPEAVVIEKPQDVKDDVIPTAQAYYITTDIGEGSGTHVYSYSGSSAVSDKKIGDLNAKYVYSSGEYTKPNTYVVYTNDGNVKMLNAENAELTQLFEIDSKSQLRNTSLSADKKWLAYGITYEDTPFTSEIGLFNTETKELKQLVKKTEMEVYQGFSILGWRNNDKELIVSALGGDAGAVWGDIYQVSVATGEIKKVLPADLKADAMNYFIRGELSPNADKWLFTYCSKPGPNEDEPSSGGQPCTSGTELRTYDLDTKQIKTVYQNLRYDNNSDKNILRSILSFKWEDDKTILAVVPGAMLEIEASLANKASELLTFDGTNPQRFKDNYTSIISVNKKRIVFSRDEDTKIYDRETQKIESLNLSDNKQQLASWLE